MNYGSTSSCSACTGRTKYSGAGASQCSDVSTGYYTTGCNSSSNNCTGQSQCTGATYCEGGVAKDCPDATANKRTTFPAEYYNPVFKHSSLQSADGRSAITQCQALSWYNPGDRAGLYEYVNYNSTSGKYDNTTTWQYMSVKAGYYLTTKGSCGAYAYYKEVKACPANSYCPGKSEVGCNTSNQATVHTTNFGLEACPGSYGTSPSGSTAATQCYLTTSVGKFVETKNAAEKDCTDGKYCVGGVKVNYGSTGGSAECSALTAPVVTGGTFTSVSPRSASSNCRYTAPTPQVPTYCATKTSNTISYSGTAWGTNIYSVTAKAGSIISNNNTKDATCSQCGKGTFSAGGTKTNCDNCPGVEKGWSVGTATGLSLVTQCTETTTPTTTDSPIATICTAGTLTKNATNATTWGAATASGLTAKAGRYVNGITCTACEAGSYTSTATTATSCTPAAKGYYVSGTEKTAQTPCAAGTYTSATGKSSCANAAAGTYTTGCQVTSNNTACTGTEVCGNNQYSSAKASACTACATAKGYGNSGTTAAVHAEVTSCKVTCGAGTYVPTAAGGCVNVGTGHWGAGGTVNQTQTLGRTACATGLTTIGYGAGANEASDCGKVLHLGDKGKIHLRSEKKTSPAFNVRIGNQTFFGNMSTVLKGKLRVKNGTTTYSVYDDSM